MNPTDLEPWQWPEETWRGIVDRVRAGRSLKPRTWPGGARCAFALSFDADHDTIPLRDNDRSPMRLSQGQYGSRRALPRILDMVRRHQCPTTFFYPAVSALLYPDEVREAVSDGHEIGVHSWIHERNTILQGKDEYDLTCRAMETLEKVSGQTPVGIRTASWDFSENTLDIIEKIGFLYDSSLMADDDPYELVAHGRRTGIVELPPEWIRDDAVYFHFERFASYRPYTPPSAFEEILRAEFDAAWEEGGMFLLTLHPHVIGHRSRLPVIDQLLAYAREKGSVWFATHAQIATVCKAELDAEAA
jgi:peptidoglycan-N-acetylglucosamine deacetylase